MTEIQGIDHLNRSKLYTQATPDNLPEEPTGKELLQVAKKKCGNLQLFSEPERLIGEINGRLDEILEKGTKNANYQTGQADKEENAEENAG